VQHKVKHEAASAKETVASCRMQENWVPKKVYRSQVERLTQTKNGSFYLVLFRNSDNDSSSDARDTCAKISLGDTGHVA
jgi:hypothetical protein